MCSPIGIKRPLDKPMMSENEIKALEKGIEPVFKDYETKGLNQRAINKLIGESNAQWYLGKKTKDPIVEIVTTLGDYKRPQIAPP